MLRHHCNNAVFKQLVTSTWLNEGFVQAIGAMTPAATAFMALALLGTVEKAVTYMTLVPVMAGIILATGFEPSFNSFGFLAAVGACGARAFKAVLQVTPAPQTGVLHIPKWNGTAFFVLDSDREAESFRAACPA